MSTRSKMSIIKAGYHGYRGLDHIGYYNTTIMRARTRKGHVTDTRDVVPLSFYQKKPKTLLYLVFL